jgi:hypothetical protein
MAAASDLARQGAQVCVYVHLSALVVGIDYNLHK